MIIVQSVWLETGETSSPSPGLANLGLAEPAPRHLLLGRRLLAVRFEHERRDGAGGARGHLNRSGETKLANVGRMKPNSDQTDKLSQSLDCRESITFILRSSLDLDTIGDPTGVRL